MARSAVPLHTTPLSKVCQYSFLVRVCGVRASTLFTGKLAGQERRPRRRFILMHLVASHLRMALVRFQMAATHARVHAHSQSTLPDHPCTSMSGPGRTVCCSASLVRAAPVSLRTQSLHMYANNPEIRYQLVNCSHLLRLTVKDGRSCRYRF